VGTASFSHKSSDPITYIRYNQIRIYGATTSGGAKTLIDTVSIDTSQQFTEYTYAGSTYTYFYTAYYNSNLDTISAYSDEFTSSSFSRRSIKRIIEAGLRKALTKIDESPRSVLTWDICLEIVQDGIDEILGKKRTWPFLRTISSGTTTTASQQYISKPTDLSMLEFIMIDKAQLQLMTRLHYNSFTADGSTNTTGKPTHFIEKNDLYYLLPTPDAAYDIVYEYYKVPATITSDLSTEIDLPFVPILIHYCAAHFSWVRGNDNRGDKMYKLFQNLLDDQLIEYGGPEQTGQAEYVERTSGYGPDFEGDFFIN
jgi:hypothetical protein